MQVVLLALVFTHGLVDLGKIRFERRGGGPAVGLFVDQATHLLTLVLAAALLAAAPVVSVALFDGWLERAVAPAAVVVAVVFAGGFFIRAVLRPLEPDIGEEAAMDLSNAGLYIGWLERVFVLLAVVVESPEAIGFVVAAKSIVRFPSLKDRPFAEYFLIGTLLSVLLAVAGGLILLGMGISLR